MKKLSLILLVLSFCCVAGAAQTRGSQSVKDRIKEKREVKKAVKEANNDKASSDSRKREKELIKEGWKPALGMPAIAKQLDDMNDVIYSYTGDYIFGQNTATSNTYSGAKQMAENNARLEIARSIESNLGAIVKQDQYGMEDGRSTTKAVTAITDVVKGKLGKVKPTLELYRETPEGYQVWILLAYPQEEIDRLIREAELSKYQEENKNIRNQVDSLMEL